MVTVSPEEAESEIFHAADWHFNGAYLTLRNYQRISGVLAKDNIFQFNVCMILPKHSYLTSTIKEIILKCLNAGLVQEWTKIFNPTRVSIAEKHKLQVLNVEHFLGFFLICSILYGISCCVFMGEWLYFLYQKTKRNSVAVIVI